jgi:hypothetical protein
MTAKESPAAPQTDLRALFVEQMTPQYDQQFVRGLILKNPDGSFQVQSIEMAFRAWLDGYRTAEKSQASPVLPVTILTDERIAEIGLPFELQAFQAAKYRADEGQPMTRPEQEEYDAQIGFARAVLAAGASLEPQQEHVSASPYVPGTWFDARTIEEMEAFYLSRLPAIREAAREHGYAIGLHGSTRRDFDLMAMQWREDAADKDTLAHAIAVAACGITRDGAYQWEAKPNGRFAVSLPICWTDHANPDFDKPSMGHIDLSIIESVGAVPAADRNATPIEDLWMHEDMARDATSAVVNLKRKDLQAYYVDAREELAVWKRRALTAEFALESATPPATAEQSSMPPQVPTDIIHAITQYGDERADDGLASGPALANVITRIRAALVIAQPVAPVAVSEGQIGVAIALLDEYLDEPERTSIISRIRSYLATPTGQSNQTKGEQ